MANVINRAQAKNALNELGVEITKDILQQPNVVKKNLPLLSCSLQMLILSIGQGM